MADKPLVFVYGDAPCVHTGFGTVNREIFSRLKDKYDLRFLGINYDGEDPVPGSKDFVIHGCPRHDPRGINKFPGLLKGYSPDLVFVTNDYDAAMHVVQPIIQARQFFKKRIPLVHYFPVDGEPIYVEYTDYMRTFVEVPITVTKYGQQAVKNSDPSLDIPFVYHGVDSGHFKPQPTKKVDELKEELGLTGKFVVMMAGVNQIRKQYNIAVEAFAEFAKDKDDVCLHLHTAKNTNYGWDLNRLINKLTGELQREGHKGINDRVTFTNGINGPYGIPLDVMPLLYSVGDIFLNTSCGEGFGLPIIEAMSCGLPVVYHNVTAMPEVVGEAGIPTDTAMEYHFPFGDRGLKRPIPDRDSIVEALNKLYEDRNLLTDLGDKARERVLNEPRFNWDHVAHEIGKHIDDALVEKRISDITDDEIL